MQEGEPLLAVLDVMWLFGLLKEKQAREMMYESGIVPERIPGLGAQKWWRQSQLRVLWSRQHGIFPAGDWVTWRAQIGANPQAPRHPQDGTDLTRLEPTQGP